MQKHIKKKNQKTKTETAKHIITKKHAEKTETHKQQTNKKHRHISTIKKIHKHKRPEADQTKTTTYIQKSLYNSNINRNITQT